MKNWKNGRVWFVLLAVLVVVLYIGSTGRRDTADTGTAVVTETLTQEASEETKPEGLSEEPGQEEQADFVGSEEPQAAAEVSEGLMQDDAALDPDGTYTSCEDVALYLKTYGELPGNFITKKEAQALGWEGCKRQAKFYIVR